MENMKCEEVGRSSVWRSMKSLEIQWSVPMMYMHETCRRAEKKGE